MATLNAPNKTGRLPMSTGTAGSTPPPISPVLRRGIQTRKGSAPKASLQDGISTPVKAFLNSNITPRSASRKARVDSAHTTPSDTPNGTPKDYNPGLAVTVPLLPRLSAHIGDLRGVQNSKGVKKRPASVVSEGQRSWDTRSPEGVAGGRPESPRPSSIFFHADDARPAPEHSKTTSTKTESQNRRSCFVYANGQSLEPELPLLNPCAASSIEVSIQSDSVHSDDVSDERPDSSISHVVSTQEILQGDVHSRERLGVSMSSPIEAAHQDNPPSRDSYGSPHSTGTGTPSPINLTPSKLPRPAHDRVSDQKRAGEGLDHIVVIQNSGHSRSVSVGSVNRNVYSQRIARSGSLASAPSTRASKRVSFPIAFPARMSPDPCGNVPSADLPTSSPTSTNVPLEDSPKHKLHQMNELAANARRERKVLDLEISNSSLMAINRTLEREMRKQNAELRRFRRLRRSGRLSLATSSMDGRSGRPSDATGMELEDDISELSEAESELTPSEVESVDEGSLSPEAMAESDARHREMDEKRIQLDLSKHQRLLVDSQKMNLSLKKCLSWTEDLISEGKKALAFRVRVSDIHYGGRVLSPDDRDPGSVGDRSTTSQAHHDDGDGGLKGDYEAHPTSFPAMVKPTVFERDYEGWVDGGVIDIQYG